MIFETLQDVVIPLKNPYDKKSASILLTKFMISITIIIFITLDLCYYYQEKSGIDYSETIHSVCYQKYKDHRRRQFFTDKCISKFYTSIILNKVAWLLLTGSFILKASYAWKIVDLYQNQFDVIFINIYSFACSLSKIIWFVESSYVNLIPKETEDDILNHNYSLFTRMNGNIINNIGSSLTLFALHIILNNIYRLIYVLCNAIKIIKED